MKSAQYSREIVLVGVLSIAPWGCDSGGVGEVVPGGGAGAAATGSAGALSGAAGTGAPAAGGGGVSASSENNNSGGGGDTAGAAAGIGGSSPSGGAANAAAGDTAGGASGESAARAGAANDGGGGGQAPGMGGAGAGGTGPTGDGCVIGEWPSADPLETGPYTVVTEEEVGPEAGEAEEDGTVPTFTLFRPETLGEGGRCHPLITWGNGTGATPNLYGSILGLFASHGFVVIASNNKNVAQGDPRPMNVGVTWVLEQNEDPSSVLYHQIDTTNIGATGHSQGAVATSQASADSHITTNVPIEGAQPQRELHGPAMFFCGGLDDIVGCDGAQRALDAVTTLPAMYAEYVSVDHGSWLGRGSSPSVVEGTINAWMRVHLMGDESLKPWFYGATCTLCSDSGWVIQQKNMD